MSEWLPDGEVVHSSPTTKTRSREGTNEVKGPRAEGAAVLETSLGNGPSGADMEALCHSHDPRQEVSAYGRRMGSSSASFLTAWINGYGTYPYPCQRHPKPRFSSMSRSRYDSTSDVFNHSIT
jgi:hypothetical protein